MAVGLFVAFSAGCAGPAQLRIQTSQADDESLTFVVVNVGGSPTAALRVSMANADVFFIDSEDCSGRKLAPYDSCTVHIGFFATTTAEPEGMLVIDDGHGARVTAPLDAILSPSPQLAASTDDSVVSLNEGDTGDVVVHVHNAGSGTTGPITLDFPPSLIASDTCSGTALGAGIPCAFTIEYKAPFGGNPPETVSGTVQADPGGSAPVTVEFDVFGQLQVGGSLASPAAADATGTITIDAILYSEYPTVGPLQLSIVNGTVPQHAYEPFVIVAGQDHCSGQTLTSAMSSCDVTIGLDPRLSAGVTYSATLLVQGGSETATLPMTVMRSNP